VRGIYPAGLRETGLGNALFTATHELPLVVEIADDEDIDTDEVVATAGFFTVMDVLQVAVRSGAHGAAVRISAVPDRARLRVEYTPAASGPDEADAWLAARDLPLSQMVPDWTAHAGTPVLWYLVLKTIVHSGLPYAAERAGYAWDNWLLYAKGGAAWVHSNYSAVDPAFLRVGVNVSGSGTQSGWIAGGGLEYGLTPNWTLFAEYDYIGLGTHGVTMTGGGATIAANVKQNISIVKGGINFKFNAF